jgi:hypothetical protein
MTALTYVQAIYFIDFNLFFQLCIYFNYVKSLHPLVNNNLDDILKLKQLHL